MTTQLASSLMEELRVALPAALSLGPYATIPLSGGRTAHIFSGETADQDAHDAMQPEGLLAKYVPIASFPIAESGAYCIVV